jgi:hypothetical protein
VLVVGEREIAHAELSQEPQGVQRAPDRLAALGTHERGDPAGGMGGAHVVGRARQGEVRGIPTGESADEGDLFERRGHGGRVVHRPWDEDRPELSADAARAQPGQVRAGRRDRGGQVQDVQVVCRLHPRLPGEVVVAVNEGMVIQEPGDAVRGGGGHPDRQPHPSRVTI